MLSSSFWLKYIFKRIPRPSAKNDFNRRHLFWQLDVLHALYEYPVINTVSSNFEHYLFLNQKITFTGLNSDPRANILTSVCLYFLI